MRCEDFRSNIKCLTTVLNCFVTHRLIGVYLTVSLLTVPNRVSYNNIIITRISIFKIFESERFVDDKMKIYNFFIVVFYIKFAFQ